MDHLPADLPEAARRYIDGLPQGRFAGFSMTPLDATGVPAWMVGLFLDEAHGLKGAMPSGYGYGTTDGQAIIGAVAEIAEMICPTLRLREEPRRIGSYDELVAEFGRDLVADPLTLGLPAGSPVTRDTPLAWIEATRARNGERVWVPMDVAACDFFELPEGYQPFTTLITNGLGAGPDVEWAVGHGLLECLQRDGNGLLFRALDAGVLLDLEGADVGEDARALLEARRPRHRGAAEVRHRRVRPDQPLRRGLRPRARPRVPIMLSACGEACDPDPRRALHKALLEFCSARVRKTYGHGPMAEPLRVAPPGYVDDFVRTALPSPRAGGKPRAARHDGLDRHGLGRPQARARRLGLLRAVAASPSRACPAPTGRPRRSRPTRARAAASPASGWKRRASTCSTSTARRGTAPSASSRSSCPTSRSRR